MRRLTRDEDGTILVFVAIALAVLLGMIALSFDMGRLAASQSELQSFADNVALAAAGELDGRGDSIDRARAAAAAMIADSQTFGTGGRALAATDVSLGGDVRLTFMSAIDADDAAPLADTVIDADGGYSTAEQRMARYVRVRVRDHDVPLTFAAAFVGMSGEDEPNHAVSGDAVAGFTQFACDTTPLMFCIPHTGWTADANVGDLLVLRTGGNGAAWQPGNFGFLDPTTTAIPNPAGPCAGMSATGNKLWQCLVGAAGQVTSCYEINNGVDTEPGQKNGLAAAFNTRFDQFDTTMNDERNDPDYAPAPNVIDGYETPRQGKKCDSINMTPDQSAKNTPLNQESRPLPVDDCISSGTCASSFVGSDRFGDGVWAQGRRAYIDTNYGNNNRNYADDTDPFPTATTRYQFYLREIGATSAGRILGSPRRETGVPQCHQNPSTDPDRRSIIAAAVDCQTNTFSGRASDIPVQEFVKIFMVQPVGTDHSDFNFYGEVVGSVGGAGSATDGTFRDFVQLYR